MDISVPMGEFVVTVNVPGAAAVKRYQTSKVELVQEWLASESVAFTVEPERGAAFTPSSTEFAHSSLLGGGGCGQGFGEQTP